jgi:aminomethyltransferase
MKEGIKRTPLHDWHVAQGANMAEFGGYDMPLWYSSVKEEHLSVLTAMGLFDTSHMAVVSVEGADAMDLLQRCFTQDLSACIGKEKKPQFPGRCVYGAFLNAAGHVIDDAIVYMLAENRYMIVVNAGMGAPVAHHIGDHIEGRSATVTDHTDRIAKIDLQGAPSARLLGEMLEDPDGVFSAMPYFSFKGGFGPLGSDTTAVRTDDGTPILLSRTGYTGEFGFEIFAEPEQIVPLWERIIDLGKSRGLLTCGLAARDSLRAGAVLPLSHQDIGDWPFINHPWQFTLPFTADGRQFTKDFTGAAALMSTTDADHTLPFVGDDPRKVPADTAEVYDPDGDRLGRVLTCATDMGIGWADGRIYSIASPDRPSDFKPRGLSCGFIKIDRHLAPGREVELRDKRRNIRVRVAADIRPDRTARRPLKEMR